MAALQTSTLHPASQNFFVNMRDECANPGTMCALVISCGNNGMSRLHMCVDNMILPYGSLIAIGYLATLILTAGNPFMIKCEDAPESDSVYFTRFTSRLVLNIINALADCCSLLSATIFFQMSPLDLYLGLLASFVSLRFARSFTLCFHLTAILLLEIPPYGNACCGMKTPAGILVLALLTLFLLLKCVVAVPLSDMRLLAHSEWLALDATMVHSLLPSWSCATLQ